MMINLIYAVICSGSSIDGETNNVSLFNILDQITIYDHPKKDGVVSIPFEIFTSWIRTNPEIPSKGNQRITYKDPSGKSLGRVETIIDLSSAERYRNRVKFSTLPVKTSGRHTFVIEYQGEGENRWKEVASLPLTIVFNPNDINDPASEEPIHERI
jgi:hypothetical protein